MRQALVAAAVLAGLCGPPLARANPVTQHMLAGAQHFPDERYAEPLVAFPPADQSRGARPRRPRRGGGGAGGPAQRPPPARRGLGGPGAGGAPAGAGAARTMTTRRPTPTPAPTPGPRRRWAAPLIAAAIGLLGALAATLYLHHAAAAAVDRVLRERLLGAGESAAAPLGRGPGGAAELRAGMRSDQLDGAD